jgi:tRNA (mo5U34)-methyltransferase
MELTGDYLLAKSTEYADYLARIKSDHDFDWYPYGVLNNFVHLREIFNAYPLEKLATGRILDIGAADGDLAFFLSSLNYKVDVVENPSTNYNNCTGLRILATETKQEVKILELDIDNEITKLLENETVNLTFFLGILYHLKNPIQVLEYLSIKSRYLILSTRVARVAHHVKIDKLKVAYLLGPSESNNDATNWWIFTRNALIQLLERTGWEIVVEKSVGDLIDSNPYDPSHDERIFLLLKSRI